MQLAPLLLATSLALNAAGLAAFLFRPALMPQPLRAALGVVTAEEAAARARAERRAQAARAAARPLWDRLRSDDLRTLVARLRAAGFGAAAVRAVANAEIDARFDARFRALRREREQAPYWRQPPYLVTGSKALEDLNQIYRERARLLRDLLGAEGYAAGAADPSAAQRRAYGDLPQAKIDLVQRVNDDYADMIGQVRAGMQGVTLPEDRAKLALLEREKRADLAALLTPAEFADYELRSSTITAAMRTALTILGASEAEFRAIFDAQRPHADALYPAGGAATIPLAQARTEALKLVQEPLRAALGPERFADYLRATNSDFQQMHRLTQGQGVPAESIRRAFEARATAAEASTRILADRSLSAEQRKAALEAVAQTARATLIGNLGPGAGQAYVSGANWLRYIERGGAVTLQPDGGILYRTGPPPPAAAPAR